MMRLKEGGKDRQWLSEASIAAFVSNGLSITGNILRQSKSARPEYGLEIPHGQYRRLLLVQHHQQHVGILVVL
jgi:hypothetical protein